MAHTLIGCFVDHLPYYRQETINARLGVYTPRSTLAQWSGRCGAGLAPQVALPEFDPNDPFGTALAPVHEGS